MYKLFCNSCYVFFQVSERQVRISDNDWFYCRSCGSGNTTVEDVPE